MTVELTKFENEPTQIEKDIMEKHVKKGPDTFRSTQQEIGLWAKENFGDNISKYPGHISEGHPLGSLPALMGMAEEICGELMGSVLKRIQGRDKDAQGNPKTNEQHKAEIADALADCLIFMSDFASREDIDLQKVFMTVWDKQVSKRSQKTWNSDKAKEHPGLLITNVEWPWPLDTLVQKVGDESKTYIVTTSLPRNHGAYVVIEWKNPGDGSTQKDTLYEPEGYKVVGKTSPCTVTPKSFIGVDFAKAADDGPSYETVGTAISVSVWDADKPSQELTEVKETKKKKKGKKKSKNSKK